MISARPEALLLAALLAGPAQAARPKPPPPLPPLELPGNAPILPVEIAGQTVRLTVDLGGDPFVMLTPAAAARLNLAAAQRPDGAKVDRRVLRVAVGQASITVPYTRETLRIDGRSLIGPVLTPAAAPGGAAAGSDGTIGLPLLPHDRVTLVFRPATPADRPLRLAARASGGSGSLAFAWAVPGQPGIEVELHHLRPDSVASVAAASSLASAGAGHLQGPVRRVEIGFGVARPVRVLQLDRPVAVAGLPLNRVEVRLFDWAGRSQLPPDADGDDGLTVTGSRGRQRGWPILKLGRDVLAGCASLSWQRDRSGDGGDFELRCPAG
jgi:hypothetical protein